LLWFSLKRGKPTIIVIISEMGGVSDNQIERMGLWNNQSMENVYLVSLHRDALKVLAGFKINSLSCKSARESVSPPTDLEILIFPKLEALRNKLIADGIQRYRYLEF
jgi:hypothetical protein